MSTIPIETRHLLRLALTLLLHYDITSGAVFKAQDLIDDIFHSELDYLSNMEDCLIDKQGKPLLISRWFVDELSGLIVLYGGGESMKGVHLHGAYPKGLGDTWPQIEDTLREYRRAEGTLSKLKAATHD